MVYVGLFYCLFILTLLYLYDSLYYKINGWLLSMFMTVVAQFKCEVTNILVKCKHGIMKKVNLIDRTIILGAVNAVRHLG